MKRRVRPKMSEWMRAWHKLQLPCIVCNEGPCDPHHAVPKSRGGEDSWANVHPLCRQHHADFHQIMGQVISFSAGHAEARIANATRWLGTFPPAQFPFSYRALPPQVLEEMVFDGVPGWEGYQEGGEDE